MKQHVVCCGLPIPESRLLYETLRGSADTKVKSPEEDRKAEKAISPTKHLLTHHADDIFRTARIAEFCEVNEKRLKMIIVVSDLLGEMERRMPEFPHQHKMGADHAIELNANGAPSFTGPGAGAYAKAILKTIADESAETLVVQAERLHIDPAREWARIEAFTGLSFAGDNGAAAFLENVKAARPAIIRPKQGSESLLDIAHILRSIRLSPPLTAYLRKFGYERQQSWADEAPDATARSLDDGPGTIVGFYTEGTLYELEARRFESSVQKLGLPIHIERIPDQGSWIANVRTKPSVLQELRSKKDGPLLYVDVDAVLQANPWPLLRGYTQDAAFCVMRDGHARSGTVLINDTPGARTFLTDWKSRLDCGPDDWDQYPLTKMVTDSAASVATGADYTIGLLPVSMCYVFDRDKSQLCFPPAVPVIEHLQASREGEDRLIVEGGAGRLERRRARLAELEKPPNSHSTPDD